MSRRQETHPAIIIRIPPEVREALAAFAESNGMKNKQGLPNISEAARTLLLRGMTGYTADGDFKIAMMNARTEWLERVNGEWRAAMARLTAIGLGG